MNADPLDELWRSQPTPPLAISDELLRALCTVHRRDNRRLLWLNFQEVIPALVMTVIFGASAWSAQSGRWAFATGAAACLGVAGFLSATSLRQRAREARFGNTVRDQLARALSQARHREWLYLQIFWWYLLPIVLGWAAILYVSALRAGTSLSLWIYIGLCLAFFAWVYRANRRIAVNQFRPRRLELERLLQSLDTDDDGASQISG